MTRKKEIALIENLIAYLQLLLEERKKNTWSFASLEDAKLTYRTMLNLMLDRKKPLGHDT